MKDIKKMTYRELKQEVIANRCEMTTATIERKRELIRRNHELMVEIRGSLSGQGRGWNRWLGPGV